MKSRFTLTANKAAPGSDRMLTFAPVRSAPDEESQFTGASKGSTVSLLAAGEVASTLERGKEYFLEITPAN